MQPPLSAALAEMYWQPPRPAVPARRCIYPSNSLIAGTQLCCVCVCAYDSCANVFQDTGEVQVEAGQHCKNDLQS